MDNNTKKDKERECVKSLKAFEQMWNHTKHEKNRGRDRGRQGGIA